MHDHDGLDAEIAAHYREVPERDRLAAGPASLERVRTWELLERHLPPAPAVVVDVGGAAGVVVAAAISRFASTFDGLLRGFLDEPGFEAIVERDVRDGQHRNPTERPEWFTTAYFHRPDELSQEITEAGLRLHALVGVEGPGLMLPDIERRLADPARRERVLAAIRRVESEASLLGASAHLLAVAHRGG